MIEFLFLFFVVEYCFYELVEKLKEVIFIDFEINMFFY